MKKLIIVCVVLLSACATEVVKPTSQELKNKNSLENMNANEAAVGCSTDHTALGFQSGKECMDAVFAASMRG